MATKKFHIGRRSGIVSSLRFVKGNVTSNLDLIGFQVKVVAVLESVLVAKENALTGCSFKLGGASARWQYKDTTPEDLEVLVVGAFASTEFVGRLVAISMWEQVAHKDEMLERVGPILHLQSGREKHSTHAISDGAVVAFHTTNFTGGVRGRDLDMKARITEQVMDPCSFAKFTTLVKPYGTI